jgi:deoxyribodipyrimidine photo-lyase
MIQKERTRILNDKNVAKGETVAYWMSREQRVVDNWALLYAQQISEDLNLPLVVFFTLTTNFPGSTLRSYDFMINGLKEVALNLEDLNIPFIVSVGEPETEILSLCQRYNVSTLVTDFSPLRIGRKWRRGVAEKINVPLYEVDARNIVPVWCASDKKEFAAYTIRPKIQSRLDLHLTTFPSLKKQKKTNISQDTTCLENFLENYSGDKSVKPVEIFKPGERAALEKLDYFITKILPGGYADKRNDPSVDFLSNLSPYLHFGQISAQKIALKAKQSTASEDNKKSFLEELIIRRELADNYCYYEKNYDNFEGFPDWAKQSLRDHTQDKRQYLYSLEQFETAKTHDPIWNAAQKEMILTGKMHGYMRMYWAKKILEWSQTPEEAMKFAVILNDKYELDGRDPNGYVGCAWSIGGLHDRPWFERPIFGKIRYMNDNGLRRRFDVESYIAKVDKYQINII